VERLRHLVVIVPGIGGSVLATEDEATVWGKGLRTLTAAMGSPGRLSLAENPDLIPVGLVPKTCVMGFTVMYGYDELVRKIQRAFPVGRVEVAVPGAERCGTPDVLLFPYDFRLPIRQSAERLANEVEAQLAPLAADARSRRVIVVAHSMGGLVARYWLGPLGGVDYCRALVTAGTPHSGAPKALDWLVNGVRAGPRMLNRATAALRGWQSAYDLLPCYRAVMPVSGERLRAATGPSKAPEPVYPDEAANLLDDQTVDGWFTSQAGQGRSMHGEIEAAWAELAGTGREPEVIPLFGRGHPTPNRVVIEDGRLVVTKEDAEWRPNRGWRGDGTVPASDSIPVELDDRRGGWQARPERHQPMASSSLIVEILRNLNGESIAVRGAEQPDRPWLGMDLDDLAPADQPVRVAAQLLGTDPGNPAGVWASVTPTGALATGSPHRMEHEDGWWRAEIPVAGPGVYRVTVQAVGVPRVDRVSSSDVIGVVAE
jgi:pimeloyl-ACP methyl ester carboxylesterase